MTMTDRTARIRALNDELRQTLLGGAALITPGVAALGDEAVRRLVQTVALFDDFHHDNDPYQEHDFGAFEAEGHQIFFKIDLYEEPGVKGTDGEPVVARVLTIMLAEEY